MADNKADKALKDAKNPNIKVELFCQGDLNGNKPKVVDITDNFDWKQTIQEQPLYFGGVVGYRTVNVDDPDISGVVHLLYDSDDLDEIEKKIKQLLQATIVNAKQYEAMESLVHDAFLEQRRLQINQVYLFEHDSNGYSLGTHLIR